MPELTLSAKDRFVVHALSWAVKIATRAQLAAIVPERRLKTLCDAGLIAPQVLLARPLPPTPTAPLAVYEPRLGPTFPDFGPLLKAARDRWTEPAERTVVYQAGRRGAAMCGGKVGKSTGTHVSHDLLLASIYFAAPPERRAYWVRDDLVEGQELCPDVKLARPGRPILLELIGEHYTEGRLVELATFARQKGWPLELW
jgi:hypothetical protein